MGKNISQQGLNSFSHIVVMKILHSSNKLKFIKIQAHVKILICQIVADIYHRSQTIRRAESTPLNLKKILDTIIKGAFGIEVGQL